MAELSPKDRLQPSLLDRLTDEEPEARVESRDRRVLSMRNLKQAVLRDLAWLLNATNLDALEKLSDYPHVQRSVINFGIPDIAGKTVSGLNLSEVEKEIKKAIWDFEPRILRNTVVVKARSGEGMNGHNVISFDVEGDLWAQPYPEKLYLKTELDIETGSFQIVEQNGSMAS